MQRSEAGVQPGCTFKQSSGNGYQEVVTAQEKTRHGCLFLQTAVCWASQAFPVHRMWTVQQHVTSIQVVTATLFTTNKGILIGIPEGLNTQATSWPIPEYQGMKMYWEVEAKLHALLT
jgi:hypothetical protein